MRTLALAALACHAGCLFAPDRPGNVDAGTTCAMASTSAPRLTASIVVPDPDSAGSLLVRAGIWNGVASVLVFRPGPAFRSDCPDEVIALPSPTANVRALTEYAPGELLVLADVDGLGGWTVFHASRATRSSAVMLAIAPSEKTIQQFSAFITADVAGTNVLFGVDTRVWLGPITSAAADPTLLTNAADPEVFYRAAPVTVTGKEWALAGGRGDHLMNVTQQTAGPTMMLTSIGHPGEVLPCQTDGTQCVYRGGQALGRPGGSARIFTASDHGNSSLIYNQAFDSTNPVQLDQRYLFTDRTVLDATAAFPNDVFIAIVLATDLNLVRDVAIVRPAMTTHVTLPAGDALAAGSFLGNSDQQVLVLTKKVTDEQCLVLTGSRADQPCGT